MHILRYYSRTILLIPITLLTWNASGCSDAHDPGGYGSGSDTDTEAVDSMDSDTMDPDSGGSDSGEPDSGGSDTAGDSGEPADTEGPDEELTYEVRCADIGLTEKAASQFDADGLELQWSALHDAEANALTLSRAGSCGEGCEFSDELVFINVNGPTGSVCEEVELLHAARRIADEVEGEQELEYDEYGTTLLQDWNFDTLISGTVAFSDDPDDLQFRFFVDPTP